jgi:hypothetical protein
MAGHPNQGGSSNRQGPKVTKQGEKGPIIGSWDLKGGKASGAGRNMSGSNWTKPSPNPGKDRGKSSKEWLD